MLLLSAGLTGCHLRQYVQNHFKVGPNYGRPPAPVANDWIDAADVRVRKDPDDQRRWWTAFNDPVLSSLICSAYQQNLSLREAGFRVLEARAQLGIAVGNFFPQTQQANGDFEQRTVSLEVANRAATPQRYFSQWDYGLSLAWELDFWGRFRRAIEAADADLNASIESYDDVLVALLGDVAITYVQIRTLEQRLQYARVNVELQTETLKIATARFKGGTTSELDVDQAQSNLSQTEALIPQLEIPLRQANNRLCVLMGMPPYELRSILGPGAIPTAPPDVAVGIPADLLARRPDVRRAEREAAAQCARIGVAVADFYPHISISGNVGYSAQDFPNLFNTQAFRGNVGPSFQWNFLNYGRLVNHVRLQDARFQELVAAYQNTVLKANEDVENGLVVFLRSHERVRAYAESVEAALKAVKVALAQYKGGTIDFNRVALLEQNLVSQQDQLAQAQGDLVTGLIQVYKALGGGWQIRFDGCDQPPLSLVAPAPSAAPRTPKDIVPAPRPESLPAAPKPGAELPALPAWKAVAPASSPREEQNLKTEEQGT